METEAITLALIELILRYGPNVAVMIIKSMDPGDITVEKIRALTVQIPESYFEVK